MPRQPRIDLPHIPQHVVQRGNDRRPCFFEAIDYVRYLDELREIAGRAGCAIHAYVRAAIETQLDRRAGPAKLGRPQKSRSLPEHA